ncbi:MAG: hypothetical protein LBG87_02190 [Spirochaetaceae bacterium]|nr:hypothetical protein [Spirochaetaceae bacterium]
MSNALKEKGYRVRAIGMRADLAFPPAPPQAASRKPQAASRKPQAATYYIGAISFVKA